MKKVYEVVYEDYEDRRTLGHFETRKEAEDALNALVWRIERHDVAEYTGYFMSTTDVRILPPDYTLDLKSIFSDKAPITTTIPHTAEGVRSNALRTVPAHTDWHVLIDDEYFETFSTEAQAQACIEARDWDDTNYSIEEYEVRTSRRGDHLS